MNPLIAQSCAKLLLSRKPTSWNSVGTYALQFNRQSLLDLNYSKSTLKLLSDAARKGALSKGQIGLGQYNSKNILATEDIQNYFLAVELGARLLAIESKRAWTQTEYDCYVAYTAGGLVYCVNFYLQRAERNNFAISQQPAQDSLQSQTKSRSAAELFASLHTALNDSLESSVDDYRKTMPELPPAKALEQACRELFPPVSEFLYPIIPMILEVTPRTPKSGPNGQGPDGFGIRKLGPS